MLNHFLHDERGVTNIEVVLVMPLMITMLLGIVDIGNALLVAKKTSGAAQIVADLLTRSTSVAQADLDDADVAAQMSLEPFDKTLLGVDIESIRYMGSGATPTVIWSQTYNMTPNPDATALAAGLGQQDEGVVVVTTQYILQPVFANGIIGTNTFKEVAILRPRRGSYLVKN